MKSTKISKLRTSIRKKKLSLKFRIKIFLLNHPIIAYYHEKHILWVAKQKLSRAIKKCDAKTSAYNRQYHVFKIGNSYQVLCRLDFKLSKRLSQKEKDKLDVIKIRQSAIYTSPLHLLKNNLPVRNLRT